MAYTIPAKVVEEFQKRALPDVCKFRAKGVTTTDEYGLPETEALSYRTYAGSEDIPCLITASRAFENEELPDQTTVASRYTIHVPKDFVFNTQDVIEYNSTRLFEIRRITAVGSWDVLNELICQELSTDYDYL